MANKKNVDQMERIANEASTEIFEGGLAEVSEDSDLENVDSFMIRNAEIDDEQ